MKTTVCELCNTKIRNCNIAKHIQSCNGVYAKYTPLTVCKWCYKEFTEIDNIPNHVRWCLENPSRSEFLNTLGNNRRSRTDDSIRQQSISVKKAPADGKYAAANQNRIGKPGTPHLTRVKTTDARESTSITT